MAVSPRDRKRQQRARERVRDDGGSTEVIKAVDTIPPEWADDCKMWVSPPGPDDARPRVNWDIGKATADLIEAHAKTFGVTLEDVLREVGTRFLMDRPQLYWAMKSAKINISEN